MLILVVPRSRGPNNPLQSPGAFWPQVLWPRTGLDTLKGSRTVTCRCLPGPSGGRSASLAPITRT